MRLKTDVVYPASIPAVLKSLLTSREISGLQKREVIRTLFRVRSGLSLGERLALLIFERRNAEWDKFSSFVLGRLSRVERQGYKDLGLKPCQTVREHTERLASIVVEVCRATRVSEPVTSIAKFIALIHDFSEALGGDVPLVGIKMPHFKVERVKSQRTWNPPTIIEERIRLLRAFSEERHLLIHLFYRHRVSKELGWAVWWSFRQYHTAETESGYIVQQAHHLETVRTAKGYEESIKWFGKTGGSESFFRRAISVVTDEYVRSEIIALTEESDQPDCENSETGACVA